MDMSECALCGQPIIQYPFEEGWTHYGKDINYELCDAKGCYCKAEPVKDRVMRTDK
jgi:hypothetical protein